MISFIICLQNESIFAIKGPPKPGKQQKMEVSRFRGTQSKLILANKLIR